LIPNSAERLAFETRFLDPVEIKNYGRAAGDQSLVRFGRKTKVI
jgi:hypothetical protein